MPTETQHLAKAEANHAFATALPLDKNINIDWAMVALFYGALHYVEASLARRNVHLRGHPKRAQLVKADPQLKAVYKAYGHLYQFGHDARYEMVQHTAKEFTSEAIPSFEQVKAHVQGLLK